MAFWEATFWICTALVAYTYVGYPLLLLIIERLRPRRSGRSRPAPQSVTVIVAAHNEEASIEGRIEELSRLIASSQVRGEIIVVSDGSSDRTAELARAYIGKNVRVLELPGQSGKAAALTAAADLAENEILVFADARQAWAPDALKLLLENFADPTVGAVSGNLIVEVSPGILAGVGLYWQFEKWLRQEESRVHSMVGVTGAISAVRRPLFSGVPHGTILDDVYWPLRVAMKGFRVVHDSRAHAYDRLPERTSDEFRRKVRTLSGNFQLLSRLPSALLPWRNPIWLQLISHKLLRLAAPWLLMATFILSAVLSGSVYSFAFRIQAIGYVVGLMGLWSNVGQRCRPLAAAGSFLVLNAAAWLAFWVWASGKTAKSWHKIVYKRLQTTPSTLVEQTGI